VTTEAYITKIVKELNKLGRNGTANPDQKHNVGSYLGEAFLWQEVMRYAEGRRDLLFDKIKTEVANWEELEAGEHEIASSPHFAFVCRVSNPVRRFSADALAKEMRKKFKIPEPVVREMVEQAKVPTKPTVSKKVMERQ
jgi:hypothetical protein